MHYNERGAALPKRRKSPPTISHDQPDPLRYLKQRGTRWHYVRRVPQHVATLDPRGLIQTSLKTTSLDVAKIKRDALEKADDLFWSGLGQGDEVRRTVELYNAGRARALALGFQYLTTESLATSSPVEQLVMRVEAAGRNGGDAPAVLGAIEEPSPTVREAMEFYLDVMAADDAKGMSPNQVAAWKKIKRGSVESFIEVVSNKPLMDITRVDAQAFYQHWQARIRDEGISGNTANRSFGNMRKLFRIYSNWISADVRNPFEGLSFRDRKRDKRKVPPFEAEWIRTKFLVAGAFGALNDEARLIFLTLVETGCRPSEICNLTADQIVLDAKVPHLSIRYQPNRLIKTESSVREIPLVGVSLAAMKKAPNGFPRYRDRETSFSAIMMKTLRGRKLLPTAAHGVYSMRHGFEKRMQEAGLDYDLRCRLMGHSNDRPEYGDGGSLEWRRRQLRRIVLPFDKSIV